MNKVKILKREGSFDIFIKLCDRIKQSFNTAVKFMLTQTQMEIVDIKRSIITKS